ncbi:type III secretion system export apparatus subunit SctT [Sphingomonas lenta]|uniref:EscT/YscT/HrcT family type III secretion system export apparatus protein n=1 Tax=Sphingomonas lenta TaxID=1141887 RepID=A0A2A2SCI8_9SPHN|nr:type III secretion system export apparatus subunit SctT [Sphingomonas lenta]PAX06976.1 EscT/YscT/HrcT family type III secretion system export apparatus protein [Sphingomonas lenta]
MNGWSDQLLLLGVATARIAAAFLMMPIFSTETVPTLVRNSIFVSLGIVSLALQPPLDTALLGPGQWGTIFAKEVFVGVLIGFFFGSVLWALESAGQIIDTKIGATMAQVVDPLSGHQTSLNGAFLGRLAGVVFIFSGGLSLLLQVIMESYALWPVAAPMPSLDPRGLALFEAEFGRLMVLATLFAAPVLTVLFLIDAGLGLVNRFAQQLNVFVLSMSIKSFAATVILFLLVGSFIEAIVRDLASRPQVLLAILRGLSGS